MRKLVRTGRNIFHNESEGSWYSPYESSDAQPPPIIKVGNGTGSTLSLPLRNIIRLGYTREENSPKRMLSHNLYPAGARYVPL